MASVLVNNQELWPMATDAVLCDAATSTLLASFIAGSTGTADDVYTQVPAMKVRAATAMLGYLTLLGTYTAWYLCCLVQVLMNFTYGEAEVMSAMPFIPIEALVQACVIQPDSSPDAQMALLDMATYSAASLANIVSFDEASHTIRAMGNLPLWISAMILQASVVNSIDLCGGGQEPSGFGADAAEGDEELEDSPVHLPYQIVRMLCMMCSTEEGEAFVCSILTSSDDGVRTVYLRCNVYV
jgi:hypothetical protein